MIELLVDGELFATELTRVTIGSSDDCHVKLDGVDARHCDISRDRDYWKLAPRAPTYFNGSVLAGPVQLGTEDVIRVGDHTVQRKPLVSEPVERDLIVAARDLAGRAVYADWLEERGHADRAEFLRLTARAAGQQPTDPEFAATAIRIQQLARGLDQGWRLELASADVEGCKELRREFTCNMSWDALEPTDSPLVRNCGACKSDVYYCRSEREATTHVRQGRCIVLDLGVDSAKVDRSPPRGPRPLPPGALPPGMYMMPPPPRCKECVFVEGANFCGQCGAPRP